MFQTSKDSTQSNNDDHDGDEDESEEMKHEGEVDQEQMKLEEDGKQEIQFESPTKVVFKVNMNGRKTNQFAVTVGSNHLVPQQRQQVPFFSIFLGLLYAVVKWFFSCFKADCPDICIANFHVNDNIFDNLPQLTFPLTHFNPTCPH